MIPRGGRHGRQISFSSAASSLLAAILLVVFTSGSQAKPVGSAFLNHFEKHEVLSTTDNVEFHWTADARANEIEMGIIAESTGWVGIGVNDKGTMKGLDIAVVQKLEDGQWTVGDYFSTGFEKPARDPDSRQNVILVSAERNITHTAVVISRHLTTCDDLDINIGSAPLFVTYALGATDDFQYHMARGSKQISFFLDNILKEAPFVPADRQYDQGNFSTANIVGTAEQYTFDFDTNLALPGYTVPHTGETSTYTCFKFNLTEQLGDNPVYYTGLSASASHKAVHHSNLYSCPPSGFAKIKNGQEDCYVMPDGCETISAWVSGVDYIETPDGVGNVLGGTGCSAGDSQCKNLFIMQVHYENIDRIQGLPPGVEMRAYVSNQPPKHELGVYRVLVPYPDINVADGQEAIATSDCPGSCTSNLPDGGVTVFLAFPHGHLTSQHIRLQHFRSGRELEPLLEAKYFDFNKQAGHYLSRRVLPGDQFRLTCDLNNTIGQDVVGGVTTTDEMCQVFLAYYPKVTNNLQTCGTASSRPGEAFCGEDAQMGAQPHLWDERFVIDVADTGIPDDYIPLDLEDEQCNIRAYAEINDPLAWEAWSLATVLLLLGMLFIFQVTGYIMNAASEKFRDMSYRHQANVKVYVMALVGLTASFALLMGGGSMILSGKRMIVETQADGMLSVSVATEMGILGANLVSLVFIFELIAKPEMNWALMIHHLVTIAVTTVLNFAFVETLQTQWAQVGFVLALHAATEQPVYISLLIKRFSSNPKVGSRAFYATCAYTLVSKTGIFIWSMVLLISLDYETTMLFSWLPATKWPTVMRYLVPTLVIALYLIQLWQAWILFAIARGSGTKNNKNKNSGLEGKANMTSISSGDSSVIAPTTLMVVATLDENSSSSDDESSGNMV